MPGVTALRFISGNAMVMVFDDPTVLGVCGVCGVDGVLVPALSCRSDRGGRSA